MKFTIALPAIFGTLALAAPAAVEYIEKRAVGRVDLCRATNYGQCTTLTIDTTVNGGCTNLPSNLNNQVLSVRLNPTGGTFYCRLYNNVGCQASTNTNEDTWFFNYDVPNLGAGDFTIGNRASSIFCGTNA